MYLKGVLFDFGDTLAYIDKKSNRRYTDGLLSILRKYGYQKDLVNLTSSLGKAYYDSSRGEKRFHSLLGHACDCAHRRDKGEIQNKTIKQTHLDEPFQPQPVFHPAQLCMHPVPKQRKSGLRVAVIISSA